MLVKHREDGGYCGEHKGGFSVTSVQASIPTVFES